MKIFFIFVISLEVICFASFSIFFSEPYEKMAKYDVPQKISSLTWFEKLNEYHPYLTYARKDLEMDLTKSKSTSGDKPSVNIAIVGGSFARDFANFIKSGRASRIIKEFPGLSSLGENLHFLNLSASAYRQPQQMISSLLFLEKADIFVSIEGFNELISSPRYGCPKRDWNRQFFRYSPDHSNHWSTLGRSATNIFLLFEKASHFGISTVKLAFYLTQDLLFSFIQNIQDKMIRYSLENCRSKIEVANVKEVTNEWIEAVKKHHLLFLGTKKLLITALQPNQHLPGSKPLSDAEIETINNSPYQDLEKKILETYPMAIRKFRDLKQSSDLNLVDLTEVFISERSTVYRDGCCHVNDLGNSLIARKLLKKLDSAVEIVLSRETK